MTNLLVRDIDPTLKRKLEERARAHGRSLSDEAKALIRRGVGDEPKSKDAVGLGKRLFNLLPDRWRGDDLVFDLPKDTPEPAKFG